MIKIKKLDRDFLAQRVELLNNELISEFLNVNEIFTLEKTIVWFEKIKNDISRFDCVFFFEDRIVGMGGLTHINITNKNAELYVYLDPSFQGKGLGLQSTIELCKYGFYRLGLNKIYLYTFSENIRANKLYEKVNFKLEGVLRKHSYKNGELCDRHIYGLLKDEFYK